ncbi:MAG: cell division protein FtsQ/DivIB [Fusobacterium sp.]|nr:cell division protein FtsQ/DivIB [Fusobacterium sp.]
MILRIIIFSLVAYVFFLIPKNFLSLDYFKITKINVVDNSKILESELTSLTKKIYNKKNVQLNYEELEKFYKKDLRIEKLKFEDVGLGEIKITAEGKKLKCYTIKDNKVFLVDKNGEIFGYLHENEREFLPILIANNREERRELIEILDRISGIYLVKYISQFSKISKDEYKIILIDGIKLKIKSDISLEKLKIAERLYLDVKETKKVDYLDLRFNDYIIKYIGDDE